MQTTLFIVTSVALSAIVLATIFGKYPKAKDSETVWRKLDDHEKAISE
jgi:hypothetical protein